MGCFPRTNRGDKPGFHSRHPPPHPAPGPGGRRVVSVPGAGPPSHPPFSPPPPRALPSLPVTCGRRCGGPEACYCSSSSFSSSPPGLRRRGGGGGGGAGNPGGGGGARGWLLSSPGRLRGPYLGPPRLGQCAAWDWARMAARLARVPARCESARREEEEEEEEGSERAPAGARGPERRSEGPSPRRAGGRWGRLPRAGGRATARAGPAGRGGEGGGKRDRGEGRGGWEGAAAARVRAGAAVAARFTPACLGGTLFVSHNAPRGRPGRGRGGAGPG